MTLREQQSRFALLFSKLVQFAYEKGYEVSYGCAYHVPCPQCGYYHHSEVSKHKNRLAVDLNLFRDGKYLTRTEDHLPLGDYWESLDPKCSWGGRFSDGNHYSYGE